MNLIDKVRSYLIDDEFMINIYNSQIHLINYEYIIHFDSSKVLIKGPFKIISIMGSNLVVTKLLDNEILISGIIKGLEFKNEK